MKEIIKMLVVLTAICAVCGYLLAGVRSLTKERIEEQVLSNVKIPAVKAALPSGISNLDTLVKDRKEITVGKEKRIVFIGKKDGKPFSFVFEMSSKGFGGDIGVMVGFYADEEKLSGIGITTHKETPGLGSKVADDNFRTGFKDRALSDKFKIKSEDGVIDAITGATISSKGVCSAVAAAVKEYKNIKSKIQ